MTMPRLLLQAGTGRRFIWTAALAGRPDMTEIIDPEPTPDPEPTTDPDSMTDPEPAAPKRGRPRKESP